MSKETAASTNTTITSKEKARKELENEFMIKFGFIPNGMRELSLSPMAAKIYLTAVEHKKEYSTLGSTERHVVDYLTSEHHKDEYSIKMHKNFLLKKANMKTTDLETIKSGGRKDLERLGKLGWIALATRHILTNYGKQVTDEELDQFEQHGIEKGIWYEIASYVGMKFVSNVVNNIGRPMLDSQFQ